MGWTVQRQRLTVVSAVAALWLGSIVGAIVYGWWVLAVAVAGSIAIAVWFVALEIATRRRTMNLRGEKAERMGEREHPPRPSLSHSSRNA